MPAGSNQKYGFEKKPCQIEKKIKFRRAHTYNTLTLNTLLSPPPPPPPPSNKPTSYQENEMSPLPYPDR